MTNMDIYEQAKKIISQRDFVEFLKLLRQDLKKNPNEWENGDLESFLDGLEGYSTDKVQEMPSWKTFAELLLAAKVYE